VEFKEKGGVERRKRFAGEAGSGLGIVAVGAADGFGGEEVVVTADLGVEGFFALIEVFAAFDGDGCDRGEQGDGEDNGAYRHIRAGL
jgi:hypothetical protein